MDVWPQTGEGTIQDGLEKEVYSNLSECISKPFTFSFSSLIFNCSNVCSDIWASGCEMAAKSESGEECLEEIIGKALSEEGVGEKVNTEKQKNSANVDSSALCWKGADA